MLVLVGLNHKSAPLAVREKLGFSEAELPLAVERLVTGDPVEEGIIVSTCNRVEVVARAKDRHAAAAAVKEFLAREHGVSLDEVDKFTYELEGSEAVRHLFRVVSGLDSMVLGEPQILGQVKRAYEVAREAGATGAVLDRLLQQGLAAAKRVRTETGISRHAVSIAFAAVELAKKIFGDLGGRSALLLGAGKMTELAARHLVSNGVSRIVVANRTYSRAAALAERFAGEAVNWDEGFAFLERVDIVVTGTAAAEPVLTKAIVQKAARARRSGPLFLIDIAVPRDVAPDVNDLDNVYLYDIDDLQGVVDSNIEERRRQAGLAAAMIEGEVASFARWRQSLDLAPTITALRDRLHGIGKAEIERFRRRLGTLSTDQRQAVEDLTRAVVQKILHNPIRHLKGCATEGSGSDVAGLYRRIFDIPDDLTPAPDGSEPAAASASPEAPGAPGPGGRDD
jgi:glutamyl-tRNA reductase